MISSPPRPCGSKPVLVAALYRFAPLPDVSALRAPLMALCRTRGIFGTLLLAPEGINGTVAGNDEAIAALLSRIGTIPGMDGLEVKFSRAETMPFHRIKVRLKKEIVTMGVGEIDPPGDAGAYVSPSDWNALIADPDTVVIDTRNTYETAIGTFARAVDPKTRSFSEFPAWSDKNLEDLKGRRIAMFCTGGIRCEKATAYVKSLGVEEVFHLKGGILKYLEDVPESESLWRGECFVFDERVSVTHGLGLGDATLCRACRHPLTPNDHASPLFADGVSCPHCHDQRSDADRARYAERQRQVDLAERRRMPSPIGGGK